jgi:hypothetical protein
MASGNDPFHVTSAPGEDVAALAKKGVPACPARSAALRAHTLPSRERMRQPARPSPNRKHPKLAPSIHSASGRAPHP